jgi:pyrrolidone-carboxylate peptidase
MSAFAAVLLGVLILGAPVRAQVTTQTELGDAGDDYVASAFAAYRAAHPGGACRAAGSGKRVLVTGYGQFLGAAYNVSGTVVRAMADPAFWPERVTTGEPGRPLRPDAAPGKPAAADHGGAAYNRTIFIDGERYEACFLVLDVVWDFAAAIIVSEESAFKPQTVVMTGRWSDSLSVEAGALNKTDAVPGYDSDGNPLDDLNRARSPWVLPDDPVGAEVAMNWDARALAKASAADAKTLGYPAVGQAKARPGNDYLCNNVSYVALRAAEHRPVSLAGGRIVLDPPEFERKPVTGFLHFPAVDSAHALSGYGQGVYDWGRVLARTIRLASQ